MGFLSTILGSAAKEPIEAIGNVFDKLFTSDEEKRHAEAVMEKLKQQPALLAGEISKVHASHRSVFVAGARPFILWVAGISLAFFYIPQYAMAAYIWTAQCLESGELVAYPVSADGLIELVIALLGLGVLRTIEKAKGLTK